MTRRLFTCVRGARTHNLRGVDLQLFGGELVALTGPSGAGKSSLAVDTLYAEGQRRFVESFSPYARQFLERLDRPPADAVEPVAAAVAVDRRAPIKSSRSTVATMAELEPFLAALFAREAVPRCPACGVSARRLDVTSAVDEVLREVQSGPATSAPRSLVTYPLRTTDEQGYLELRERLVRDGIRRLRVGGEVRTIDEVRPSEVVNAPLEVVVDRLALSDRPRLREAIERAWTEGQGLAKVIDPDGLERQANRGLSCPCCARSFEPPRAGLFSYNNPAGACPTCRGFGRVIGIDWAKVIPDESKTLGQHAIRAWAGKSAQWERTQLRKLCQREGIRFDLPFRELTQAQRRLILDGEPGGYEGGGYPGVRGWFAWLQTRTYKMHVRVFLARYRSYDPCPDCGGARLNTTSRTYQVGGLDLGAWHQLDVRGARQNVQDLVCSDAGAQRAKDELLLRLSYLEAVGLGHLSLHRPARTLSGGEAQRVSLTAALGTSLVGALFVVDEPTVGLHPTDVPPLLDTLRALARRGNSVVVIEHDAQVIAACDRVVEMGPAAGPHGGQVRFDGTPEQLRERHDLPTGRLLAGLPPVSTGARNARTSHAKSRRAPHGQLQIRGARGHNLRGLDVTIPCGVFVAVTGPSGSGKSSLIGRILAPAAQLATGEIPDEPSLEHDAVEGLASFKRVVHVDQSPLGRTSRGNAATYTKAWDCVRTLLATEGVRQDGLDVPSASAFSFNTEGGRCETCRGEGFETVEMQFLADVSLRCPVCQGRRFKEEVLAVRLSGLTVAELLTATVDELLALAHEGAGRSTWRSLRNRLSPLQRVGLGYLPIGQPLTTLSGGEAQRLKLARALGEVESSHDARSVLLLVDEPSVGLHASDVAYVVSALHDLVDRGVSVVVVEHDPALIAAADHVIDLGPGAGSEGGRVVAQGTPEIVAKADTRTGGVLATWFAAQSAANDPAATLAPPLAPPLTNAAAKKRGGQARAQPDASATSAASAAQADETRISVRHAREHNLRDVSADIPRDALVVVTGPSGSGKSTLAFDVVFAEGQRRFLETLSAYARQFLPTLPRPDVEAVLGVPPSIALEQRTTRGGHTSTVATVTEVAHYLRLLWAKVGTPYCPRCDVPIEAKEPAEIIARVRASSGSGSVYARAVRARKGTHLDVFTRATQAGYTEMRVDGQSMPIDPPPKLAKSKEHTIDLLAARGAFAKMDEVRLRDALERSEGELWVVRSAHRGAEEAEGTVFSTRRACPKCNTGVPALDPRHFSFNTELGRCESCEGTGMAEGTDELDDGARGTPCRACRGTRLAAIPRGVRIAGRTYPQLTSRAVDEVIDEVGALEEALRRDGPTWLLAEAPVRELRRRVEFLKTVGLGYLSLDRPARTLSGGEMQRLRLSAQLGSGLTGALYVLDEPTIGLHPRDTGRLLGNLRSLVQTGSTVLVVEHDVETIRAADWLIDLGPGGGRQGGHIMAQGTPAMVLANPASPTGQALTQPVQLAADDALFDATQLGPSITLRGARGHNLAGVDLEVPVGKLTVVAGVSGSGKSTLIRQVFYPAVRRALKLEAPEPLPFDALAGVKHIKRAIAVDQSPIGRTSRSVPATFLGIFDPIRKLFAAMPEAQVRGFGPARFSFNGTSGRCPACEGAGVVISEMSFLPDVSTPCEACGGHRYEPSTLEIKWSNHSIGEVLKATASEAAELFVAHPKIARPLSLLDQLGVGYLALGQGSNTLSGGEAQRLKLAAELAETTRHQPTLYVLDEPTTGLHLSDVRRLVGVLRQLVARGDTLVVIEHHPEVIATADWVVELGPEGGSQGGRLVARGRPRDVARLPTATGHVLREMFAGPVEALATRAPRKRRTGT